MNTNSSTILLYSMKVSDDKTYVIVSCAPIEIIIYPKGTNNSYYTYIQKCILNGRQ